MPAPCPTVWEYPRIVSTCDPDTTSVTMVEAVCAGMSPPARTGSEELNIRPRIVGAGTAKPSSEIFSDVYSCYILYTILFRVKLKDSTESYSDVTSWLSGYFPESRIGQGWLTFVLSPLSYLFLPVEFGMGFEFDSE